MNYSKQEFNKKGQSEIIGMLMIVVIISFLLLFVFKAIFFDGGGSGFSDAKEENQATSAINAILSTSSTCTSDTYFSDLIIDCTQDSMPGSFESEIICRDGQGTCAFAREKIESMLSDTFGLWNIPYEFKVMDPDGIEITELGINNVSSERQAELRMTQGGVRAAYQPLTMRYGYGVLSIWLCIGGECP